MNINSTQKSRILITCFLALTLVRPAVGWAGDAEPIVGPITDIRLLKIEPDFTLALNGDRYGNLANSMNVEFTKNDGKRINARLNPNGPNAVIASAPVPDPQSVVGLDVSVHGKPVDTSAFVLSVKPDTDTNAPHLTFKFATYRSTVSPTQFSLIVRKEAGPDFPADPTKIKVDIMPRGASDVRLRDISNSHLVVDYTAPEKFEVDAVSVTLDDSSGTGARTIGGLVEKSKGDPNQPQITSVDILYLDRNSGEGKLKLEGSGFGDDEKRIQIWLVPRNPDLKISEATALRAEDNVIECLFKFIRYEGYSLPLRLAKVTLSIDRSEPKTISLLREAAFVASVQKRESRYYMVSKPIGPAQDDTLRYDYKVLDHTSADFLFGSGVANNFYVVQLAVVNNGRKKVAVPLASIKADIEWRHGSAQGDQRLLFLEGPPSITPLPLKDVSAFFDADNKAKSKKARFFNFVDALGVLGAGLTQFFGPGFQDGHTILTGPFKKGAQGFLGDLTGQQLQNLTGRSWQEVEEISPGGGALVKFIYIPRNDQNFGPGKSRAERVNGENVADKGGSNKDNVRERSLKKRIFDIQSMEVIGFDVPDTDPKQATQR